MERKGETGRLSTSLLKSLLAHDHVTSLPSKSSIPKKNDFVQFLNPKFWNSFRTNRTFGVRA